MCPQNHPLWCKIIKKRSIVIKANAFVMNLHTWKRKLLTNELLKLQFVQFFFSAFQQWAETQTMSNSKPFSNVRKHKPQRESDEKCSPTQLSRYVWPSWRCSCLYRRFPSQTPSLSLSLSLRVTNRKQEFHTSSISSSNYSFTLSDMHSLPALFGILHISNATRPVRRNMLWFLASCWATLPQLYKMLAVL